MLINTLTTTCAERVSNGLNIELLLTKNPELHSKKCSLSFHFRTDKIMLFMSLHLRDNSAINCPVNDLSYPSKGRCLFSDNSVVVSEYMKTYQEVPASTHGMS